MVTPSLTSVSKCFLKSISDSCEYQRRLDVADIDGENQCTAEFDRAYHGCGIIVSAGHAPLPSKRFVTCVMTTLLLALNINDNIV